MARPVRGIRERLLRIKAVMVPVDDHERVRSLEFQAKVASDIWNCFRPEITEYSFLDRPDALKKNVICNSSVLAVTAAVRSAAVATRQLFQYEDWVQWALLATKGPFIFTPEPLIRYRIHAESSTYVVSEEYLRKLYSMIELLLTLHTLTDDPGLRALSESELLYNLASIRNIYAEAAPGGIAHSLPESRHLARKFDGSSWERSALELQSQVDQLQTQVAALSERLVTIRGSRVYRSLVKVRGLLTAIKREAIKR